MKVIITTGDGFNALPVVQVVGKDPKKVAEAFNEAQKILLPDKK